MLCVSQSDHIGQQQQQQQESGALINKAHNTELVRCELVLTKATEIFAKEEEKNY